MNIPTPWGITGKTLKWTWNKITIFLLLKTYKESHEYEFKRLRLGSHWKKLGEHLEYSLRLANPADHESIKSRVAFRALTALRSVTMVFEATGHGISYQQKIELINLD